MEFRILGPLEVESDGRTIPLGGAKQRAVLALLLLARGRPISSERLIEDVWKGAPPETALKSIQVYVSHLRKGLQPDRLVTREGGYELLVEPGELDVDLFDALVREASGAAPDLAAARLREALALFRGAPLADLSLEPWAQLEISKLEERRLSALEARIDADLALGDQRRVVGELEELVAAQPYREHFLEQLVLALYRCGRQADALAAYRRGAVRLRDELGLAPSRPLQELEQQVLRQDPALDLPRAPASRRSARRRGWKLVLAGALVLSLTAAAAVVATTTRDNVAALASAPPGIAIVDVASGELSAHIPWTEIRQPVLAITGDGSFWVWTLDGNSLVRIDPVDGRILGHISSPLGVDTRSFVVDGPHLWFSGTRLVRMDIARGAEADRYRVTGDAHDTGLAGMALGAGSLWISRHQAGELLRVDPANGRVLRRFRGLLAPYAVRFADGAAWVVTFNGVKRIDAATNTVVDTPLPPQVAEIAVGGGFAWVSNEAKGTVYKIDRSGQVVATYETGDGARDMTYEDGTLWVANQDVGTVTGIDAATGGERTFRFGHPLQSLASLHGKLLVELWPGRTYEQRIDALGGRVARLLTPTYEFDHPDPAISGNGYVHAFNFQAERATCAPLLGYPDAPPPRGRELAPEVATAMPRLSYDRRTYTFTVRTGFRFAPPSNAALGAETYRFSIERALNPRLGPRAPGFGVLGDLQGARAFHGGRAAHVSGIRVRGNQISFTLTKPSPDFLERLELPYFCPVPMTTPILSGGVGVYTGPAPAGAGPYTFSGPVWNGEYAILKRNPNYGGSRPQRLDSIAFREGIDAEKGVGRIEQGRFDLLEQYDPMLAPGGEIARRFGRAGDARVHHRAFPQAFTSYVALDAGTFPFSNPTFRREVATALDRAAMATASEEIPTDRLLPPAVRGGRPPRHRSVGRAAARRLTGARPIRVNVAVRADDDQAARTAEILRANLAPLGFAVTTIVVADLAQAMRAQAPRIQLAVLSTSLDYPDPGSLLTKMLGTDVPDGWLPRSTARDIGRLASLTGRRRDHEAVALAARLATRDVPVVAFGTRAVGSLVGPRLGCRVWNGVDSGLDLAALCLVRP